MAKLTLMFYKGAGGSVVDTVIDAVEQGLYSHVAVLILGGTLEALGIKDPQDTYPGTWLHSADKYTNDPRAVFVDVDIPDMTGAEAVAQSLIGSPYGYVSAIEGGICDLTGFCMESIGTFTNDCSEVGTRILRGGGLKLLPGIPPGDITPWKLYQAVTNLKETIIMAKHIYGCKKDTPDLRDHLYHSKVDKDALPASVDLRAKCSPVVDQGQLGSCTANAIVSGLREYQLLQKGNFLALSRLFLYWQERNIEGTVSIDSGAEISDGMKTLNTIGVCPETDFPYDITTFTNAPTDKDIADAKPYLIAEYHRITSLDLLKAALAEGLPVVVGINVYDSFETDAVTSTGIVPMPDTTTENLLGGHAVLVVGYDDSKRQFIVRNSWGSGWGDQGYFHLPYDYYIQGYVIDCWTSRN